MSTLSQTPTPTQTVGFIGQGFIGGSMADDVEERGFSVVRFAREEPHVGNRAQIADCDVVFVAVPTPTTPEGFDPSVLRSVLPLVGQGKVAVIKSTVLPGTTRRLQAEFPEITLMHAPEFLREKYAAEDTRHPARTILGLPEDTPRYRQAAKQVLAILPDAPYQLVCSSEEAELIKYGGNCFLATKLIFMNTLFDAATAVGANYDVVAEAMAADPRIGGSHMQVVDSSGHPGAVPGRGAGGHCFPKDLAAFREFYEHAAEDEAGLALLRALETKNNALLRASRKDLDLLEGIYGE